jgi:hypothetical protein
VFYLVFSVEVGKKRKKEVFFLIIIYLNNRQRKTNKKISFCSTKFLFTHDVFEHLQKHVAQAKALDVT